MTEEIHNFRLQYFFLLVSLSSLLVPDGLAQNLVPNPGFEEETQNVCTVNPQNPTTKDWIFVTDFTPSITTNLVDPSCKNYYAAPLEGNHVLSLMISGEFHSTEVCQYIQAELLTPMEVGRKYYAEMWFRDDSVKNNRLYYPKSYNNLGMYFSASALKSEAYRLNLHSQLDSIQFLQVDGWTCLSGYLTPKKEYRYIVLGKAFNNEPNKKEELLIKRKYADKFGYFNVVDDVKVIDVTKEVDSIEARGPKIISDKITFVKNTTTLSNIPESFEHLNRLYLYLNEKPGIKLKIIGHTDDEGTYEYNHSLSEKRAEKVYQYYLSKGILPERLFYEGKGKTEPLHPNTSEENRQFNRRVEFVLH